mmetsp:Transcript_44147/g.73505  ORF Transcript_44147/g.73505 Transcript_44147/m.73505 type:complete len:232 (+) Transcript_44147:329-1024(+)
MAGLLSAGGPAEDFKRNAFWNRMGPPMVASTRAHTVAENATSPMRPLSRASDAIMKPSSPRPIMAHPTCVMPRKASEPVAPNTPLASLPTKAATVSSAPNFSAGPWNSACTGMENPTLAAKKRRTAHGRMCCGRGDCSHISFVEGIVPKISPDMNTPSSGVEYMYSARKLKLMATSPIKACIFQRASSSTLFAFSLFSIKCLTVTQQIDPNTNISMEAASGRTKCHADGCS